LGQAKWPKLNIYGQAASAQTGKTPNTIESAFALGTLDLLASEFCADLRSRSDVHGSCGNRKWLK
jgi:hypothetical protein